MKTYTAKLVCFGDGGDSVEYGEGCHGSGYGTPDRPHAAKPSDDKVFPDGTPAIDKRPALETEEGFSWVFNGPMVNVDLPPKTVDPCPDLTDSLMVRAMVEDRGNEFGNLAVLQIAHEKTSKQPGPLDSVDIDTYIEGWKQRGARIGHYQDGQIVWDS